jgi:hypothetical protein
MSKTVTIPTGGDNPFVVILGGVKYVYKPGETVEVPDGVALEIEEWERWHEKYYGENVPPFASPIDDITATVGQTIVVKSVDENGKPTEWEAADAGDKWRKIKGETFDGSGVATVTITEDEDGNEISLKKILFIFAAPNSTISSFALNIMSESKFNQLFYSTTYGDHKNASCPIIGFVDASMPYFTGWIAKTSGYFNQNNLYSLGGARDPRVASKNITSITLGLGAAGADWHLGADCVYEIWGVDA